jgi:hypothetical protein
VNDFEYLREINFTSLKSQNVPQELARLGARRLAPLASHATHNETYKSLRDYAFP